MSSFVCIVCEEELASEREYNAHVCDLLPLLELGDGWAQDARTAVEGMPLIESDSVLGANGNKWEAHSGATAPGQFCAFDSAQGRAVRNFYTDFANEVV